jgi:hypothetical protein
MASSISLHRTAAPHPQHSRLRSRARVHAMSAHPVPSTRGTRWPSTRSCSRKHEGRSAASRPPAVTTRCATETLRHHDIGVSARPYDGLALTPLPRSLTGLVARGRPDQPYRADIGPRTHSTVIPRDSRHYRMSRRAEALHGYAPWPVRGGVRAPLGARSSSTGRRGTSSLI